MKKIGAVVLLTLAAGIGVACQRTTVAGVTLSVETGKPYADYQDLRTRRVDTDGFLATGFQLESDNTIDLRFYTHGKPEDKELIEPTINRVKYLSQNLTKEHPVHVVFYDGDPKMTMNGKPVGTGEVLKEITLPITQ